MFLFVLMCLYFQHPWVIIHGCARRLLSTAVPVGLHPRLCPWVITHGCVLSPLRGSDINCVLTVGYVRFAHFTHGCVLTPLWGYLWLSPIPWGYTHVCARRLSPTAFMRIASVTMNFLYLFSILISSWRYCEKQSREGRRLDWRCCHPVVPNSFFLVGCPSGHCPRDMLLSAGGLASTQNA